MPNFVLLCVELSEDYNLTKNPSILEILFLHRYWFDLQLHVQLIQH